MGLLAALIFPLLLLNYHRTALLTPEHLEVVNRVASAHHGRAALNGIDEPKVLPTFNVTPWRETLASRPYLRLPRH